MNPFVTRRVNKAIALLLIPASVGTDSRYSRIRSIVANHDVIQRSRDVETELVLSQIVVIARRDTSSGATHVSQFVIQPVSTLNVRNPIPAHAKKDSTKVRNQMFVNPSAKKDAPTELA